MLAKYGSIQLLGRLLPGLLGFLAAAVLTRLLPPDQYGTYGLALALSQLLALAAFGWLGLSITRLATGRSVDARFVNSVLALFAILAACASIVGACAFLLPFAPGVAAIVAAAAAGGIVFAYLDVNSAFLTAALDFGGFFRLNVSRAAVGAALACAAAYWTRDGRAVFACSLLATLGVCLLLPRRTHASLRDGIDRRTIVRLFGFGMPIAASLALFSLCAWSDRLILGIDAGIAAVGFYTAATVVVQYTLQMVAQAVGSAAYPLAVLAYDSGSRLASEQQLAQNFIALVGVLVPGAVGLSLLAPNVVAVFVGPSYREAVIQLTPLLASAAVISGIRSNFIDHAFQLTGSTWHYFWISASMAAVNLAALILLVPRYGYIGAGAAVVATELAGLVLAILAARRVYRLPFPARDTAKVGLAVLAMAGALLPFADLRGITVLAGQIALGLAIYVLALWSLNLLNLRQATMTTLLNWLTAR